MRIANVNIDSIVAARRCLAAGRLDEAERWSAEALKASPRHPAALQVRARVQHRRGELRAAEATLKQAIAADSSVCELHADLANLLQDRGELEGAIRAYRRALRLNPESAEIHNDLGTAYGAKHDLAAAIECYRNAVRLQPGHAVAHGNLGAAYRKLGHISAARRALQRELWLRLKHGIGRLLPRRKRPLDAGHELLRAGHVSLAEELARSALEREPGHLAAIGLLAEALERRGAVDDAIATLERAPAAGPGRLARLSAGKALHGGDAERAESLAREALAASPEDARLHCLLGEALMRRKAPDEAEAGFRRALELDPSLLAPWIRLAELLREAGRLDEAEACAAHALELDEDCAAARLARGMVLKAKGRSKPAIAELEKAIELDPDQVPAYQQLARLQREEDDVKAAERSLRAALARRPREPSLLADLALVLGDQMRYEEAFPMVDEALARAPRSLGALTCKGLLLDQTGRREEAFACLSEAQRVAPADDNAHFCAALHLLKYKAFAAGWDLYERRRSLPGFIGRYREFPFPEWDGTALAGRTVLVYPEQGLGDEIMFGGCLPQLAAQAGGVVVECDRKLELLFRRSFPQCTVVPRHRSVANDWVSQLDPQPDVQMPLGSLAKRFRRSEADFPAHSGYLAADPAKVARWRERLEGLGPGRCIGLSWRGGVGYTGRVRRSLSLEQLLPLLRLPGLHFVSLQYTDVREEIAELARRHGVQVHHWPQAIDDYDETAALVCALDEVLTVCTAIVHLTGALGRKGTVMVPFGADWRYGGEGERMPWYPSLRLVRQQKIGEWRPVLDEVARRLSA